MPLLGGEGEGLGIKTTFQNIWLIFKTWPTKFYSNGYELGCVQEGGVGVGVEGGECTTRWKHLGLGLVFCLPHFIKLMACMGSSDHT